MEENVALDSKNQEKFSKSIKGIKKLIKAGKIKNKKEKPTKTQKIRKTTKKQKPRIFKKPRGLVYISHIPHGFYENEMTQYFKQFGVVTNARVIRSKKTGKSRGCAFVEFLQPAVAQIVAETMNNYLMGKRLLKAVYIPPEKQRKAGRKFWNETNNPGANLRLKQKKEYNDNGTEADDLKVAKKLISNFLQTKEKLNSLGLNYDFFKPVDVPDTFKEKLETKCIVQDSSIEVPSIDVSKLKKSKENKVGLTPKAVITTTKTSSTCNKKEDVTKGKKGKDIEFINLEQQSEDDSNEDEFDSDAFEMILESDDNDDSLASDSTDDEDSNIESAEESDENEKLLRLDSASDSEDIESESKMKIDKRWAKKATKSPLLLKPKNEMGKRKQPTGHQSGKNKKMKPSQNKKKNRS